MREYNARNPRIAMVKARQNQVDFEKRISELETQVALLTEILVESKPVEKPEAVAKPKNKKVKEVE